MNSICQTTDFTAIVSKLTGRTVYVNNDLNRYLVNPEWNPAPLRKVIDTWFLRLDETKVAKKVPKSLQDAVRALADCCTREEFSQAIHRVLILEYKNPVNSKLHGYSQKILIELMIQLWCAKLIAWPVKYQDPFKAPMIHLANAGFRNNLPIYLQKTNDYIHRGIKGSGENHGYAAQFRFLLDKVLSRCGIEEIGDITPDTFQCTVEHTRQNKMHSVPIQALLQLLREQYHKATICWTPVDFGFYKNKMGHLARDDNFTWLVSKDPEMKEWARFAIEHLKTTPANFRKRKSSVNSFLNHFLEHPKLPRNPVEYFNIHNRPDTIFAIPGNNGRVTMSIVNEFLNEVLFKVCAQPNDNEMPILMPGFANPHPKQSYKNVNKGETHREAMPTRFINLAMHILTENDFAWPKKIGRTKDNFRWTNPNTGKFESVWSPVRTYVILIKLLLPARTYQVRMLDSGEADTFRYLGDNRWETNKNPHHPSADNRTIEQGVFRKYKRKDGSEGAIFYFNTNKTADSESISKGYVMPWEKKDALQLLVELRNWQEEYNPVQRPTAWSDILELKKDKHADDLKKMGSNLFLFRDPTNNTRPDLPITDVRIRNLWLKLMAEMEYRLSQAGETLDNGSPINLVRTRDQSGQPASATFDLHSLRVSIITAMYEEGTPPEYLMKIVGHATVLMTLYYIKFHPDTLSLRMDEALLERQRKSQKEMAGFIMRASRQELEPAIAFRHDSALDAATSGTGVGFLVMDHGICPVAGKRCHEGLTIYDPATKTTKFQGVPGGASNCTRCRFFITGPAFLFGMEAQVNNLAYRLKKASFSFEKAQEKFDHLADAHADSLSGGLPFHNHRALEIAEAAYESAMSHVDGIALSLQAAYALTEQSIRINNQNKGNGLALIVAGGTEELEALLSEGHEFEQLNRICVNATLFDGLNIDWQQPNLERARLFDRMLRNSGHEPWFSLLDDEDVLHIANAMGKFLYARLDSKIVHALVDGRTTLQAVGLDKAFTEQLENLKPKTLSVYPKTSILEQI